jgi:hypothetical protein
MGTFLTKRHTLLPVALLAVSAALFFSTGTSVGSRPHRSTVIACLARHEFRYLHEPTNCEFFARQYYPSGRLRRFREVGGRKLKWTNWGGSVAVGNGMSVYAVPLKVVAYRRTLCPDGRWYYGEVVTHSSIGREQHLRLARCGARRFPPLESAGARGS